MIKSDSCKDGASKSNEVCEVNNMLQYMSMAADNTEDKDIVVSICANCGKEGANNVCNKCKQVRYCNASCKKKHRHKHKKQCEEHVRLETEKQDKELFKQQNPSEDCPICFLRLPTLNTGRRYYNCCGKVICSGCCYAPVYDDQGNEVDNHKCPYCRTPWPSSDEEIVRRYKIRMKKNDAEAIRCLGCLYSDGELGLPQNYAKALKLYHRAAELGHTPAYLNIGYAHDYGEGVEGDLKKATYYYELASMMGDVVARHNLGNIEKKAGNIDRALKHYMIAVRSGYAKSLEKIKELYSNGDDATKEDYTTALRLYLTYLGEIKSDQRDKAAAADDQYRYY